ncbi:hypothetical protein D3C85_1225580 [compost metagenome]
MRSSDRRRTRRPDHPEGRASSQKAAPARTPSSATGRRAGARSRPSGRRRPARRRERPAYPAAAQNGVWARRRRAARSEGPRPPAARFPAGRPPGDQRSHPPRPGSSPESGASPARPGQGRRTAIARAAASHRPAAARSGPADSLFQRPALRPRTGPVARRRPATPPPPRTRSRDRRLRDDAAPPHAGTIRCQDVSRRCSAAPGRPSAPLPSRTPGPAP